MELSIIVLGILTLTIPLHPSIIYGSFLKFQFFLNFIARKYNAFINKIFLIILFFFINLIHGDPSVNQDY